MQCPTCKSYGKWQKDLNGFKFCSVCSTQSQDYAPESLEIDDLINTGRKKTKKRVVNEGNKVTFMEAFQIVLEVQSSTLVDLGYPIDIYDTVGELWFQYLSKYFEETDKLNINNYTMDTWIKEEGFNREKKLKINIINNNNTFNKTTEFSDSFLEETEGVYQVRKNYPPGKLKGLPTLGMSVCFIYLALRRHQTGVSANDISTWITFGHLPYLLIEELPEEANQWWNLSPNLCTPTPQYISINTHKLAKYLNLSIPPLNSSLFCKNLVSRMELPEEIYLLASQLKKEYFSNRNVKKNKNKLNNNHTDVEIKEDATTIKNLESGEILLEKNDRKEVLIVMAFIVISIKYYYCYSYRLEKRLNDDEDFEKRINKAGEEQLLKWIAETTEKMMVLNDESGSAWSMRNILSMNSEQQQQYFKFCEKYIFTKKGLVSDHFWLAEFFEESAQELKKQENKNNQNSKNNNNIKNQNPKPIPSQITTEEREENALYYTIFKDKLGAFYNHLLILCSQFVQLSVPSLNKTVSKMEERIKSKNQREKRKST